jgi:allantoinase
VAFVSAPDPFAGFDMVITSDRVCVDGTLRPAAVCIADGRIVEIREPADAPPARASVVLTPDEALLPGVVDTHVHVNEPGRTGWEGFETATQAALAGGVTTLLDMPLNSIPPTVDPEALAAKRAAADGKCRVDVGFWGGAVPSSLGSLKALERDVFGFKCFLLDSGVPEFPPLDAAQLEAAMREIADFDGLLIVHAEDAGAIAAAPAAAGGRYADFLASRPDAAETRAIETVIEAARRTGARAHIVHLSSAEALPALRAARADGVRITVETCPHYLTLAAEDVEDGHTEFKCCPPVRDRGNQDRLWGALVDGDIGLVVSDHSPCPPELKALDDGDFGAAWGGVSSLQLGLPLVWTHARERGVGLAAVSGWMSGGPAALVGLTRKGRIAEGADADLVVFAPDEPYRVDAHELRHRHRVTPYDGMQLTGIVRGVFLRGRPTSADDPASGTLLSPEGT